MEMDLSERKSAPDLRDMAKPKRGAELEKMLWWWLRDSVDHTWANDELRREDERIAQGKTPSDDQASIPAWLREASLNTIYQMCERLIGSVKARPMAVRAFARGGHDLQMMKIAGKRDMQISAALSATNFNYHAGRAAEDAVYSGQGFVRFGLKDAPGGRMRYEARYSHWGGEIVDPLNIDDDTLEYSQFHMSVNWLDMQQLLAMYPEHFDRIKKLCNEGVGGPNQSRPGDVRRRQYWRPDRSWIDQATEWGGGYGVASSRERTGAVLGKAYWWEYERAGGRVASKQLMTAPFLTTPYADEVLLLGEPMESVTGIIPVAQLLSGRYMDSGHPFPPVVRLPRGNERVMQYLLRGSLFLMGRSLFLFTKEAVPEEDGEGTRMDPTKWLNMLQAVDESPTRALELKSMSAEHFQRIDLSPMAAVGVKMLELMKDLNSSMMPEHPGLTERSGLTAAAAMREAANNAQLGHQKLLETWQNAFKRFGEYTLETLRHAEDILPSGLAMRENGMRMTRGDLYDDIEITEEELAQGHFGIAVRAEERKETDQYRTAIKQEVVKMLSVVAPDMAVAAALIAWKTEAPDAEVDELIEMMAKAGYPIPPSMLDPAVAEMVEQMQQERAKDGKEAQMTELMKKRAEAYAKIMQGSKFAAESGITAAQAEMEAQCKWTGSRTPAGICKRTSADNC